MRFCVRTLSLLAAGKPLVFKTMLALISDKTRNNHGIRNIEKVISHICYLMERNILSYVKLRIRKTNCYKYFIFFLC